MDDQILSLEHISLSYHTMKGETPALCDLTFSVTPGEFVALVGPSGCGKSTILNLISGLLKPEAGTLLSRGRPITEADLHIGYMLQRDHLFEWRTIYSNVLLGLEISRTLTPERKEKVGEMMETYGLKSFSNARPSELSGGMRQRAALIRTLAMEPDLLLLDEPFSALDYQTRLNVCDDIGKIIKKEGKTAILVTHDISEAISMADRVIVLAARPAYVKKKIPIRFAMEERTPMKVRSAPEFKTYFNAIWKELELHDGKTIPPAAGVAAAAAEKPPPGAAVAGGTAGGPAGPVAADHGGGAQRRLSHQQPQPYVGDAGGPVPGRRAAAAYRRVVPGDRGGLPGRDPAGHRHRHLYVVAGGGGPVVLNAVPKWAVGPIFIGWMGAGMGSIIVMTLAISLIVTILSMYQGFLGTDGEKLRLMRSLGATRGQILWMLVFPASFPTLFNTLKVNVGLSWVGVIMGEFLVSRAGLGYLIVYGSQVFNMDLVMASVVILAAAAVVMYRLVLGAEKLLQHYWGVKA